MGTISQRKLADGTIRFRAEIRISRKGLANFKESKTFSSMRLAQKWLAMREEEIEENPEILLGRSDVTNITLANAIENILMKLAINMVVLKPTVFASFRNSQ